MRNIDRIHYQGRCDRAHCAKQYNHSHPPLGELRPELKEKFNGLNGRTIVKVEGDRISLALTFDDGTVYRVENNPYVVSIGREK